MYSWYMYIYTITISVLYMYMYMCVSIALSNVQKDLISMLISQTDIRNSDLSSCVLEALGGNTQQYRAIEE